MLAEDQKLKLLAQFWNQGFALITDFLTADEVELVLRGVRRLPDSEYKPIFGKVHADTADPNRRQAPVALSENAALLMVDQNLIQLISELHPAWAVASESWHVLKSLPNGEPQQLHRDFPTFETTLAIEKHEWVQASVLIALGADAKIVAAPGNFGGPVPRSKLVSLELTQSQMLLFRGDLAHAGTAYDSENLRLHCYIGVDGVERKDDSTELATYEFFRCPYCFKRCDGKLSNHERYCDKNPSKAEIAKKRKRNNDMGGQCAKCKRHYGKKNTLVKHKCEVDESSTM